MSLQLLITLAVAVAAVAAQSPTLTVNTPTSVQACLPVKITWAGGNPPYFLSLIPAGQPNGPILKDFPSQTSNSLTWEVDQPVGSAISVQIRDSTGTINYSDKVTIQPSTKTCTTGSTTPSSNSSTSSPPNTGATSNSSTSSSGSGPNSTPSSTPTTSTGGSAAAAGASASDASHIIPGFFALGLAASLAVFA